MMTFYTILKLMPRFTIENPSKVLIKVSKAASKCIGTSANLEENDTMSLEQLLYAMMLPSGNDAAYALADYFGT
jgi:D-alanyl-D-alanine carboxypeptidase